MSQLIKPFSKITKKDVGEAGGKGASLGEMTNAKNPVPQGFVILASAFDYFLKETDLHLEIGRILKEVNHKSINSVENASNNIRGLILDAEMPEDIVQEVKLAFTKLKTPLVAIRSSATAEDSSIASWAGELESYLNVSKKSLTESIQKCWSSLFTARAIFYRYEKKMLKTKVSVAVVVQRMVQSDISGIAFTVHPVTKDKNQMVIEAGYGLGESIVGGMVTPDTYVLHKKQMVIVDKNIGEQKIQIIRSRKGTKKIQVPKSQQEKQKLTDVQIKKVASMCIQIEKHYKKPQDIEWGIENGKLFILQSRPITTL